MTKVKKKGPAKLYKTTPLPVASPKPVKKKRGAPTNAFTKGNTASKGSSGLKGLTPLEIEALANKKIDKFLITRYITLNSHLTEDEARQRLEDPTISIFEKRIIGSLIGCDDALNFNQILERVAGKVEERHVHQAIDPYEGKTNEELIEEKRRLEEQNRRYLQYVEEKQGLRPHQLQESREGEVIEATATSKPREPSTNSED